MKHLTCRLFIVAMLITASVEAAAADLYVICHPGAAIVAADIRDVFLGEKQFTGTVKLVPTDNSAAQSAFLDKALKMDAAKYATAWTKKSFREGINPPPVKASDGEALEFVKHNAGACSYVATQPGDGVTIVAKL